MMMVSNPKLATRQVDHQIDLFEAACVTTAIINVIAAVEEVFFCA